MIDTNLLSLEFKSLADRHCIPLHERQIFNIMLDNIDHLTAELDRYRWLPYPKNKPTENGEYLVTMSDGCHGDDFRVIAFYVAEEDFWTDTGVEDGHYEVI